MDLNGWLYGCMRYHLAASAFRKCPKMWSTAKMTTLEIIIASLTKRGEQLAQSALAQIALDKAAKARLETSMIGGRSTRCRLPWVC
jgi:hypothetical protein